MAISRFILLLNHDFPFNCLGHARQELFYQQQFKSLIQLLYARSDWHFCLALTEEISQWLLSYHPEAIQALTEISHRKQLEMLGGPFNNAFLPMLTNNNRLEQLESSSMWLRSTFGKKPRGIHIPYGIWEPQLAQTLAACGIEFTFAPRELFLDANCPDPSHPYIVEEGGKSLFVIPYHQLNDQKTPEEELHFLLSLPSKNESILGLSLMNGNTTWLEKIMNILHANGAQFYLPTLYFKKLPATTHTFPLIYLPTSTGKILDSNESFYRNAILKRREARWLYARVMHSLLMARQIKNDKSRKKNASQSIAKVQNHQFYWHSYFGGLSHPGLREFAYSELLASDQLARDAKAVTYGLVHTDFDFDGLQENIYHSPLYMVMNHQKGGVMFEFSIFSVKKNLFNIYHQGEDLDETRRGFHDLFLPIDTTYTQWIDELVDRGIFENSYYDLRKSKNDPASLLYVCELPIQETLLEIRKHYFYKNTEFQVQYQLLNNALGIIEKIFSVELNLSSSKGYEYYFNKEKLEHATEIEHVDTLTVIERDSGGGFEMQLSQNASIWIKKIFNSVIMEKETKKIYQGDSLLIRWPCSLASTNLRQYTITIKPTVNYL